MQFFSYFEFSLERSVLKSPEYEKVVFNKAVRVSLRVFIWIFPSTKYERGKHLIFRLVDARGCINKVVGQPGVLLNRFDYSVFEIKDSNSELKIID